MARRRDQLPPEARTEVMPKAVLLGDRVARRRWLEARGLTTFADQDAATQTARRAHNITIPDARLIFRDM